MESKSLTKNIIIKGAREHNLKNISLEIPRDKMVVITGVSGSGKSTLAFDTIYAEGQRRYVESLSSYARQFLEQMRKPDVDLIQNLSPAVSIDQKSTTRNPRSTVGTVTEIHDYLRLLFARVGVPHCHKCGREITPQTVDQMVDRIMAFPQATRLQILGPVVKGRKGEYRNLLEDLRRSGFVRAKIDGEIRDLAQDINLDRYKIHTIDIVVDRIVVKEGIKGRLAEALELALKLGGGVAKVDVVDGETITFSEKYACPKDGISFEELAPRNFSFNSPYGACPRCGGLGTRNEIDPDLVIPDKNLSLSEGAIAPWRGTGHRYYKAIVRAAAEHYGIPYNDPVKEIPPYLFNVLLYGGDELVRVYYHGREGLRVYDTYYRGVINYLMDDLKEAESEYMREELAQFLSQKPCYACKGARLKPESLAVTVGGKNIAEVTAMNVKEAMEWFSHLALSNREAMIAHSIVKEIRERLSFLIDVGLDYLTIDRAAKTLAGGEAQRIRLATQIGSGLVGVLYVLDEPTIGLHARDNRRLIATLKRLRDLGNTVLVVEHDEEMMRSADYIIDIGPGAGELGGRIVEAGSLDKIMACPESITGQYLTGIKSIPIPARRRKGNRRYLVIKGARHHNLKNIDVKIPLGVLVCVTGVSGSGKSTLIDEILYRRLAHKIHKAKTVWGEHDAISGTQYIDKVISIDQSPIGRTPRSNPATYTGAFDHIRHIFALTPESRQRGYKPGRFSFNVKGGRCEACRGDGIIKIEMQFLPDVYVPCEVCKGKRYNRETLEVTYKGRNISEVLDMTICEALDFFYPIPSVKNRLQTLHDVGLGYMKLGQPATTLSGGEAQRVKLATELSRKQTGKTLYILDEPTTGLHFDDIKKLLHVLNRLVDAGNTVVIIEHNLEVIKTADWIIDLGPEGGDRGGWIVAEGSPEEVAQIPGSYTGHFLKNILPHSVVSTPYAAS